MTPSSNIILSFDLIRGHCIKHWLYEEPPPSSEIRMHVSIALLIFHPTARSDLVIRRVPPPNKPTNKCHQGDDNIRGGNAT